MPKTLKLKRAVGLFLLSLYGIGNILGAGIYVLMGKVAGAAGYAAPAAFLIALVVAAFTAFSYMELSSRFPKNAAVPVYLHKAFGVAWLSTLTGLLLVAAGLISAATLTRGFAGYLALFVTLPEWLVIGCTVALLTVVAIAGIAQSAKLAAVFTLIEVGGLVLVAVSGLPYLHNADRMLASINLSTLFAPGVLLGAFIAFYAFIGFEDMVEIAEEVRDPGKTMPKAILISLVVSTVLYILVIIAALLVRSPEQLASSAAPLADVFQAATGKSALILAGIGLAAIVNGILVQIIMGSRVLYGLSARGWLHKSLSNITATTKTPVVATIIVSVSILGLALIFPLVQLAEFTSLLILTVFAMVNASLLVIKYRTKRSDKHYTVRWWVPLLGLLTTTGMAVSALFLST
jgi:amino acid transporter